MALPYHHPLTRDLKHILASTSPDVWRELKGAKIFITGGTGFFGKWLLESWAWANQHGGLNAKATVLARNPEAFLAEFPHLARTPAIEFLKGDLLSFEFPQTHFTHILHAATPASVQLDRDDPEQMRSIIVEGTKRILALARLYPKRPRVLMTSSGAIYGIQPPELTHVPEDYQPAPELIPDSAYARGKREAEALLQAASERDVPAVIARCFAYAGPHLPLDAHYAFGNFIRDARRGGPIRIAGDGTPLRSYLYPSDLAVWLWTLLAVGKSGRVYNVGSDEGISIGDLARKVAQKYGCEVEIAKTPIPGQKSARYVPSIERARRELGLRVSIGLDEAIDRTEQYLRTREQP